MAEENVFCFYILQDYMVGRLFSNVW